MYIDQDTIEHPFAVRRGGMTLGGYYEVEFRPSERRREGGDGPVL